MGYLEFSRYGVDGICNAFIRKLKGLKLVDGGARPSETCSNSSFASILVAEKDLLLFVPVLESTFNLEKARLVVVATEPDDEHHLNSLKRLKNLVVVAFKHDVAVCKVNDVVFRTTAGVGQFELILEVLKTCFTPDTEVGTSSTSKDQFAEQRTKRLLLNENPAKDTSDINEVMREIMLAGQGTLSEVKKSRFLDLYEHYKSDQRRFLEIAWIDAMMMLKTSACVAEVEKLELQLRGDELEVDFRGWREKEYVNRPPYQIDVKGKLKLQ
jgi:hypothetical protein